MQVTGANNQGFKGQYPTAIVSGSQVITGTLMTRPADTITYALGDLIANNTVAGSVTVNQVNLARLNDSPVCIRACRLYKSTNVTTNAVFRLHLYRVSPTSITNGDNGAFSVNQTTDKIGFFDIDMTRDSTGSDSAYGRGVPGEGSEIIALPASGTQTFFWLLEARAAYTPGNAETFTPKFEIFQD